MRHILIVEDEPEIAMLERDYLEANGYETTLIADGAQALQAIKKGGYDLLVLDLMLPGMNGYEICREVREKTDIPILMVTARTESIDKIRGLGLGADDYIAKPFDPAELVARVKAHLARYDRLTAQKKGECNEEGALIFGPIRIMTKAWKVFKADAEIRFPNREFELLTYLAMNPNIVFSKEHLFERVWGYDYVGDTATVTVHINRIREKLEDDPANPKLIETVWGAGYRLNK
jgi:Response regulators consisting of a CheY-like receiver domain and a winged-helix DNA-binding domain